LEPFFLRIGIIEVTKTGFASIIDFCLLCFYRLEFEARDRHIVEEIDQPEKNLAKKHLISSNHFVTVPFTSYFKWFFLKHASV